jgi:hypothetical protein
MGWMTACTVLGEGGDGCNKEEEGLLLSEEEGLSLGVDKGGRRQLWEYNNQQRLEGWEKGGREGGRCNRDGDCGIGGGGDNITGDNGRVGGEGQGDGHYKTTSTNAS